MLRRILVIIVFLFTGFSFGFLGSSFSLFSGYLCVDLKQFIAAALPWTRAEDTLYIFAGNDLSFDEQLGYLMMSLCVFGQYLFGPRHLFGNDALRLFVDEFGGLFGIRFDETVVVSAGGVIEADIFEFVTHAIVSDHGIGLLGSTFEVIECAGRSLMKEELLRGSSSEQRTEFIEDMLFVGQLSFFG